VPKQVAQAKVRIGGFGYPRGSPKEYAMRLANTALGTFGIGRLYKEIRDEKGLAYSAFSSVSPGPTTGTFTVGFDTRPEFVGQALEAALGILQGVKSGKAPITAAELASASDIALNTFAFRFDGAAKLVQEKAVFDLFGYPDDYLDRFRAQVLAVDVGVANAAAAELAALDGLQIVVVGPPEKPSAERPFHTRVVFLTALCRHVAFGSSRTGAVAPKPARMPSPQQSPRAPRKRSPMSDKRKNTRVPLDVYMNKYVAGVPYMARTSNISRDGVSLAHLIEPAQHGSRVGLQFQLPGSEEVIYAEGEIVREWLDTSAEGSGIKFTLLTERHKKLINQYVERLDS
jgi:Peptidase M16 inactive domain/PilZ domain